MSELELYKLLEECTFQKDFHSEEKDIICFSYLFHFETLTEQFKSFLDSLDVNVFNIQLRHDYFTFNLKPICEYCEIDILELAKHLDFDNRY